jgi:hypothetical protein
MIENGPAGYIIFLEGLDESEAVAGAGVIDTLPLFLLRDECLALAPADPADANDPDRATRGGPLGS